MLRKLAAQHHCKSRSHRAQRRVRPTFSRNWDICRRLSREHPPLVLPPYGAATPSPSQNSSSRSDQAGWLVRTHELLATDRRAAHQDRPNDCGGLLCSPSPAAFVSSRVLRSNRHLSPCLLPLRFSVVAAFLKCEGFLGEL